ncbi:glycosyl hydrolase family 8 [Acuticoccus mangrovi]|uniref:cellulase n=1 Tax=Acuticoccus mangrovi TaxID=2796142 RepID=A0A934MKS0_9HYPH|nr:glycosyl hydrolase family 8 [Acuticoccus mangrovi]MBJ3775709.1 hypothetical protein [Acuticoccus mangrovi]
MLFGVLLSVTGTVGLPAPANAWSEAVVTTIAPAEWAQYKNRFIDERGRVIDREGRDVSHSEGQGYGLILSVRADDRATFDRVLDFTFESLATRNDGLVSWIYNPRAYPPVTDTNNASDGDILIAYGLVLAAVKWEAPRYLEIAEPIVDAIGRKLLYRRDGLVILRPAAFGFAADEHAEGPLVNLSYYVYGALLLFRQVDDQHPWLEAWQTGLRLTYAARSGRAGLVPDWVSLRGSQLRPAKGVAAAPRSSYDAVRIPLYMALEGRVPTAFFEPFDRAWNRNGLGMPEDYDLADDQPRQAMGDNGYRAVAALAACAARGAALPPTLQRFRPSTYFASSLHLLTLSAARANYPHCVTPLPAATIAMAEVAGRSAADDRVTTIAIGSARR